MKKLLRLLLLIIGFWLLISCQTSAANQNNIDNLDNYNLLVTLKGGDTQFGPIVSAYLKVGDGLESGVLVTSQQRLFSEASEENGSAPVFLFMKNSEGFWEEVSKHWFGEELFININYPAIADFNEDGIDDIIFVEFWDGQQFQTGKTLAYLSNESGAYSKKELEKAFSDEVFTDAANYSLDACVYSTAAGDINNDGHWDVVTSNSWVYLGDGAGNFHQKYINQPFEVTNPWGAASAVALGELMNGGKTDVLLAGANIGNNPDDLRTCRILELDEDLNTTSETILPAPYWNKKYGSKFATNIQQCLIVDIDNDDLNDILLLSSPVPDYTPETNGEWKYNLVEIYKNMGNGNFEETHEDALPGFDTNSDPSSAIKAIDLNGDSYLDLILSGASMNGFSTQPNSIWLNDGTGHFSKQDISHLLTDFTDYPGFDPIDANDGYIGSMVPILSEGSWTMMYEGMKNGDWLFLASVINPLQ